MQTTSCPCLTTAALLLLLLLVTHGVIFRQLFDASSSTYTYLVACPDTLQAALIDPVLEQVRVHAQPVAVLPDMAWLIL
jgi:hypothetical protein